VTQMRRPHDRNVSSFACQTTRSDAIVRCLDTIVGRPVSLDEKYCKRSINHLSIEASGPTSTLGKAMRFIEVGIDSSVGWLGAVGIANGQNSPRNSPS
jgi:hypothetical protein